MDKVEYPMIFTAKGKIPYFEKREEWKITDVLKNPMVWSNGQRKQNYFHAAISTSLYVSG